MNNIQTYASLEHPCDKEGNIGCEHICEKVNEKTGVCKCNEGYKLNADNKHCDKSEFIIVEYLSNCYLGSIS